MKIIHLLLFLFIWVTSFAQSAVFSGKVVSAETGMPLAGASVFAENTTIGTATDNEGNFRLRLPDGGYDLVVTYAGYTSSAKRVATNDKETYYQEFSLRVREKEMADVAVVATTEVKDGWEKYGDFFLSEFIGTTENSQRCLIKNKEVLRFYYSKKRDRLKVLADQPVIIENNALGYIIHYALDSFTHEYGKKVSVYTGSPLFEPMKTADMKTMVGWNAARSKAYNGSLLQFMRSIYHQQLEQNKFQFQFIVDENGNDKAIKVKDYYRALNYVRDDSSQTVEIKPNQQNVGVIYTGEKPPAEYSATRESEPVKFQFSTVSFLPGVNLVIEKNGYYYDQNDITISGYWSWEKVADLLPYDFETDTLN